MCRANLGMCNTALHSKGQWIRYFCGKVAKLTMTAAYYTIVLICLAEHHFAASYVHDCRMKCGVLCFHFLNIKTPSVVNHDTICESLRRHFDDDKTERAQSSKRVGFSLLHSAQCCKALLKEKAAVQLLLDEHSVARQYTAESRKAIRSEY